MRFEDLGLSEPVLRAIRAEKYEIATPIQAQAIPVIAAKRDLVGCAQTGTGKTAAFSLPLIDLLSKDRSRANDRRRPIRALILCPTRELAVQIGESLATYGRHAGLRHAVIFGGVGQFPQVRAVRNGLDILVATPGRLLDLMNQGHISLEGIELLVLDEADRMLDMGFIHDLKRIVSTTPRERQTLLFSATMPDTIRQLAKQWLRDPADVRVAPVASTAELIGQSVVFVPQRAKGALLAQWLKETAQTRTLVFTRTKHGADKVVRYLEKAGIDADAIHGNKSQSARQQALARFKSQRPPVLVATDIAARGLDVDNVSHVVNFDLPIEAETYVHRIGRSGRAGAEGQAISFVDGGEKGQLKNIERLIRRRLDVTAMNIPAVAKGDGDNRRFDDDGPRRGGPGGQLQGRQQQGRRPEGQSSGRPAGNGQNQGQGTRRTGKPGTRPAPAKFADQEFQRRRPPAPEGVEVPAGKSRRARKRRELVATGGPVGPQAGN